MIKDVLFVCEDNAALSQIAEAILSGAAGNSVRAQSVGITPLHQVDRDVVRLMSKQGIDLADRTTRDVQSIVDQSFDYVITIGDVARDQTPDLRGNPRRIHWRTPGSSPHLEQAVSEIENELASLLLYIEKYPTARELHFQPGCASIFASPGTFISAEHLPLAAEAGFKCFEMCCYLSLESFDFTEEKNVIEFLRISNDLGMPIFSVHAPYYLFDSKEDDPAHVKKVNESMKHFADLAAENGIQVVVMHVKCSSHLSQEQHDAQVLEQLLDLQDYILPLPCVFGWENVDQPYPEKHLEIIRSLNPGAFQFVLDTGHSNMDNYGARDPEDPDPTGFTERYMANCNLRLSSLHLHDNDGKEDSHKLLGDGTIDWKTFRKQLVSVGYTGPLMIECYPGLQGCDDLKQYLNDGLMSLENLR